MKAARRNGRILLGGIVVLLLAVAFYPREPFASGHFLSTWLHYGICHQSWYQDEVPSDLPPLPEVEAAVRRIGSKAIPVLLHKLDATDSAWLCSLTERLGRTSWMPDRAAINCRRAWKEQEEALYGCSVLKTQVVAAIPELALRLQQTNSMFPAANCLAEIGLPALPVFRAIWNDPQFTQHRYLLYAFERNPRVLNAMLPEMRALKSHPNDQTAGAAYSILVRHADTNEAIAVLHEALRGSRVPIARTALYQVGRMGSNAIGFVPDVAALLTHSNLFVRGSATNVLRNLDPAVAFAAGVNTNREILRSGRGRGRGLAR